MDKILLLVKLIPAIIEIVKALENAIPDQGQGAVKLAALKQILTIIDSSLSASLPAIEGIVGVLVSVFNSTQAFKK